MKIKLRLCEKLNGKRVRNKRDQNLLIRVQRHDFPVYFMTSVFKIASMFRGCSTVSLCHNIVSPTCWDFHSLHVRLLVRLGPKAENRSWFSKNKKFIFNKKCLLWRWGGNQVTSTCYGCKKLELLHSPPHFII